ncbi:MAG: hypothetical protein M3Q91_14695 [Acidobacteriota bacterium]|nr:hypothetical protein [Acidobacteriota bacterium]
MSNFQIDFGRPGFIVSQPLCGSQQREGEQYFGFESYEHAVYPHGILQVISWSAMSRSRRKGLTVVSAATNWLIAVLQSSHSHSIYDVQDVSIENFRQIHEASMGNR